MGNAQAHSLNDNASPLEKKQVALFAPHSEDDSFWPLVASFMRAAGHDLGIELRVYYAHDDRGKMRQQLQRATSGKNPVDAVVFQSFKQNGESLIKVAEKAQIPAFLMNAGVDHMKTGIPRQKYQYWIGEMFPDDEQAGFDLANQLIDIAKQRGHVGPDGKVRLAGISGIISDGGSIQRVNGLRRAIKARNDVTLNRVVPGDWQQKLAHEKFLFLLKRYPETTTVWAANDPMSLGVVTGAQQLGLSPGQELITGGVDWTQEALESIRAGHMLVSIGGHFMEGGWVMVLLHDYFQGKDFAEETLQMRTKMSAITASNVQDYLQKFGDQNWEAIDFKKFSKVHNPELTHYDFSLNAILQQF